MAANAAALSEAEWLEEEALMGMLWSPEPAAPSLAASTSVLRDDGHGHVSTARAPTRAPTRAPAPARSRRARGAPPRRKQSDSAPSPPPSPSSAPPLSSPSPAAPTKESVRNPSRERLTAELKYLRDKVVELEHEAQELQERNAVRTAQARQRALDSQCAAEQQLAERRRTEAENQRLKTAMDYQLSMAKTLESVLQKRSRSESVESKDDSGNDGGSGDGSGGSLARPRKRDRADDAVSMLFAQFQREIAQRLYPMVNEVFKELTSVEAMVNATCRLPEMKTVVDNYGCEQVFIETWEHTWIPFPYQRACDAAWQAYSDDFRKPSRVLEASIFTDELVAIKARTRCWNKDEERWLALVSVMKKFVEPDRMVMIWRGIWSLPESDAEGSQPVYTDDMAWVVVQRVPDARVGFESGTAVMVTCTRCIPLWSCLDGNVPVTGELRTGDFTNMVLNSVEEDVTAVTEAMGSILLDDALALKSGYTM